MDKEFETKGYWWPSGQNERRIPGKLIFSPKLGASLELDGAWEDKLDTVPREFINGVDYKGELFTLRNCLNINLQYNFPGIPRVIYQVNQIFKGRHFSTKEDIKFLSMAFKFTHLNDWVNQSGFRVKVSKPYIFQIEYKRPENLPVFKTSDWICYIETEYDINYQIFGIRSIKMEESQAFVIKLEPIHEEAPFEDFFLEKITALRDFLVLATNSPISILKLIGYTQEKEGQKSNFLSTEIFYQQILPPKMENLLPYQMLITYSDISKDTQAFFHNWFKMRNELKASLDLLFSQFFSETYLEERFLNYARAMEVYHRVRFPNEEVPRKVFKKQKKVIFTNTPPELKNWLKEKLKFSNEPSFEKRLKDIFDYYPFLKELIPSYVDFCKMVKNSRNFYTHYSKNLEKKAEKGINLYFLGNRLKAIFTLIILKELGFEEKEIKEIAKKPKIKWELAGTRNQISEN